MKHIFGFLFLIFIVTISSTAQNIQWASHVIGVSSEFREKQYSAEQALGKPNVLRNLGRSPSAWSPKKPNSEEFIHVAFETPMAIQQIAIAETNSPGGLKEIYAYDPQGKAHLLNRFTPGFIPIEGRLFRFFFDLTPYEVTSIKIVMDGKVLTDYFGIDAIAISDSREPITVEMKVAEEIESNYLPVALPDSVNSEYNELRPILSPDGKTLYFSRQNHPENVGGTKDDEDIWYSERDTLTGEWKKAKNIGRPLNNKGPNFISALKFDEEKTTLLLGNAYYSRNRMMQGASMSSKPLDSDEWGKPENLKIRQDYNYSDKANYYITNDQKIIVMAIERKDTYGDRDLYVSFKKKDDTWTAPINMGGVLNSADEESAPFLAEDGKTIFFSSKGFSGYGGFDIYLSRRLDESWTNWSEPENLGTGFNSEEDDVFFNFTQSSEYAYFVRGNTDNTDIFKVRLPYYQKPERVASLINNNEPQIIIEIRGTVYDAKTKEPIEAAIEYFREPDNKQVAMTSSDNINGRYSISLDEGYKYRFLAKAYNYYSSEDSLSLIGITENTIIERDIYLNPVVKDKPIVFQNLQFDFDSDRIRESSYGELNELAQMLIDNYNLHIKIDGHTCSMGSEAYNLDLSERRAASVVRYLLAKGVNENQVSYTGFGESIPVASNSYEAGREKNRRVEFTLEEINSADSASQQ